MTYVFLNLEIFVYDRLLKNLVIGFFIEISAAARENLLRRIHSCVHDKVTEESFYAMGRT
jgi:hypothetical protein